MRRLAVAFVAIVASGASIAHAEEKVPAWRVDYDSARKEATAKDRPIFLQIYSEGCIHCQRLAAGPLRNPAVVDLLNERYIPLRIEATRAPKLMAALRIQMYPTMVIADTDGKIVAFLEGYQEASALTDQLTRALVAAKTADRPKTKATPRGRRASELLAEARDAFKAERYGAALELCDLLDCTYPGLDEGRQGGQLAAEIRSTPEKLALACDQQSERLATMYATLGDTWLKKGEKEQAAACYEKAVRTAPASPVARDAQAKLAILAGRSSAEATGLQRPER